MIETMLLAAGFSTRLYPLTQTIPKPLLPFLNGKLLDYTLDYLQSFGVSKIATNAHHGKSPFIGELAKNHQVEILPFIENEILGTGGGIKNMKPFITQDHFMVVNCDFITDIDLKQALEFHKQQGALATLVLVEHPEQKRYGEVGINTKNEIVSFPKKPFKENEIRNRALFTGIHFISREIFDVMPDQNHFCIVKDVYQLLMSQGEKILGYLAKGRWMDVGEKDVYAKTQFELLKNPMPWMKPLPKIPASYPTGINLTSPVLLCDNVKFIPSSGTSIDIGPNVIISNHASLEENVSLKNCIVFPDCKVPAGSAFENKIITKDEIVSF